MCSVCIHNLLRNLNVMVSRCLNQEYGKFQLAKGWQNIVSGQGLVTEKKITENKSLFLKLAL